MTSVLRRCVQNLLITAAIAVLSMAVSPSFAQLDLAYSFESGLQGFGPNGGGITVTQDTIGATEGTQSLKIEIVELATFAGAITAELDPFIGDPPGFESLVFDLTLTEAFPDEGFVDAGITVFGSSQPDLPGGQQEGLQVQFFNDQAALGSLAIGTHEIRIDLENGANPLTFEPGSFNDIFGIEGSGMFDIIPTGIQIYINKSANAPWTGYIDNVRVGVLPDGIPGDANGDGAVDLLDLDILGTNFGLTPAEFSQGDFNEDGTVDLLDLDILGTNFGAGTSEASLAIPEPSTALLAGLTLALCIRSPRGFAKRADKATH